MLGLYVPPLGGGGSINWSDSKRANQLLGVCIEALLHAVAALR